MHLFIHLDWWFECPALKFEKDKNRTENMNNIAKPWKDPLFTRGKRPFVQRMQLFIIFVFDQDCGYFLLQRNKNQFWSDLCIVSFDETKSIFTSTEHPTLGVADEWDRPRSELFQ